MSKITNPTGDTIIRVRTKRGETHVFNMDRLASAFAEFLSDLDNEERMGWTLSARWFADEVEGLRTASRVEGR